MCQLKKPRANEITEPLAFTVCKPRLRGKAIVLQSRSMRTGFNRSQLWEKRKVSDVLRQNKNKPRSKCRNEGSKRHTFQPWSTKDKTQGKNLLPQNKNKPRRKCRSVASRQRHLRSAALGTRMDIFRLFIKFAPRSPIFTFLFSYLACGGGKNERPWERRWFLTELSHTKVKWLLHKKKEFLKKNKTNQVSVQM